MDVAGVYPRSAGEMKETLKWQGVSWNKGTSGIWLRGKWWSTRVSPDYQSSIDLQIRHIRCKSATKNGTWLQTMSTDDANEAVTVYIQ